MKKFISILIAILTVCSCMTATAFAADINDTRSETNVIMEESIVMEEASVSPRAVETLSELYGPFWPSIEMDFTLSAKRNLKVIFRATHDCTISFYKGNSIIPFKTLRLSGGTSATTYDVKNGCTAGNYSYIISTNNSQCEVAMMVVATEYT